MLYSRRVQINISLSSRIRYFSFLFPNSNYMLECPGIPAKVLYIPSKDKGFIGISMQAQVLLRHKPVLVSLGRTPTSLWGTPHATVPIYMSQNKCAGEEPIKNDQRARKGTNSHPLGWDSTHLIISTLPHVSNQTPGYTYIDQNLILAQHLLQ